MKNFPQIVHNATMVTLLGGGSAAESDLRDAMAIASVLVCADGGANTALDMGLRPDVVIGDLDSVDRARTEAQGVPLIYVDDQNSNDLEKCLAQTRAKVVLGVGFMGGRVDHQLAAFNAVAGVRDRCVMLVGVEDVVFRLPARLTLRLREGERVSLFPMSGVVAKSTGLVWEIKGLDFQTNGQIGCSNAAVGGETEIEIVSGDMLMILPKQLMKDALAAICDGLGISRPEG